MRLNLPLAALVLVTGGMTATVFSQPAVRLPEYINQLSSPRFTQRQAASKALDDLGEPALPALRQLMRKPPDEESRRRAERLVNAIEARLSAPLRHLDGHNGPVWCLAFSPDSNLLASASLDRTIKLWDLTSGKLIATCRGHTHEVLSVAFSPDGKALASASWDATVKLWDIASGKNTATLAGHAKAVLCVAFRRDGKLLASGSMDATIKLWDVASGKNTVTLQGHMKPISCLAFTRDGKTLVSGSVDTTIKLWDIAASKPLETLRGPGSEVACVAFRPGDKIIVTGDRQTIVRCYDVATGNPFSSVNRQWSLLSRATSLALSGDGWILAIAREEDVKLLDIATGTEHRMTNGHSSYVVAVAFDSAGKRMATADRDGRIKLWNVGWYMERSRGE
jgi:WD40 repeat protein